MCEGGRVLEARSVSRRFGDREALRSVSLRVQEGEIVALLGPNGSGKTTLLRVLATLLEPTTGQVFLDDLDAFEDPVGTKAKLGMMGHRSFAYGHLTLLENLVYYGRMYSLGREEALTRGVDLLERVGLGHRSNDQARILSQGMMQRLSLARALMHDPSVLLLDEPFSNLDSTGCQIIGEILRERKERGNSILLVSHNLTRISALADRAEVLVGGVIGRSVPVDLVRSRLKEEYGCALEESGPR
jgi:heme ABC exporter ATP-binding subunit CcmA